MKSIRYHEEAREEFLHEVRYYTAISARLGERFDKAIRTAEVLRGRIPGPRFTVQARNPPRLSQKFKFSLIYVHYENEILILAVAPFRKKPGYWKARQE